VLKSALLTKLSFWLVIIGVFALIAPNPVWPEWLARMTLSAGVALGLVTVGVRLWKK
jgi:multisubunit Na+/H+ antiporter MnhC subunit